jgi:HD-GYP domain-containing protein (c-di-GMP phosphodiesterase class II)
MDRKTADKRLMRIIQQIAAGNYSDEIMELTGPEYPANVQELAEAVGMMMVKIEAREFHLEQLLERIKENSLKTVTSIAVALGRRDEYTEGHGERVGVYSERLARRMGLSTQDVEDVRVAGILHDIGKIGFSDRMFCGEDTAMSEAMMLEIRSHPQWGHDILSGLDYLGPVLDYVYAHHERLDGRGYPRGLEADQIPMGARILAVADCFDAMTTDRPYQRGRPAEEALSILGSMAESGALDPDAVEAFMEDIEEHGMAD